MRYLSACCIARNEHPYIREWVDYHLLIGVESFLVYDDGAPGEAPLRDTLRDHVERGTVSVVKSIEGARRQMACYDDCLARFGAESRWIAFLDVDEFLVLQAGDDVRTLLREFEAEGGLAASWLTFGSSGHVRRPAGRVTANYVRRSKPSFKHNRHVKSIVQPARALTAKNPHAFEYRPGFRCVDERGRVVEDAFNDNTTRSLWINHYFTKSREEFLLKAARGRPDGGRFLKRQFARFDDPEQMFDYYDKHCSAVEDRSIERLASRLPAAPAAAMESTP